MAELRLVFDHPGQGDELLTRLFGFRQGASSLADFSIHFSIYVGESRWNDSAL